METNARFKSNNRLSNQLTSQVLMFVEMLVNSGIPCDEVDLRGKYVQIFSSTRSAIFMLYGLTTPEARRLTFCCSFTGWTTSIIYQEVDMRALK